jgi:hypothetical protein
MEWAREKKKALEEIEGYLVAIWPSTSAKEKQMKSEAIYQAFGTRSWTAVEELAPVELRAGYKKIVEFVQGIISGEKGSNGKASGNSTQVSRAAA